MKKKFLAGFLSCLILISVVSAMSVSTESTTDTIVKAQRFLDGILAFQGVNDAESIQSWINGALTQNAGVSSEWYVLALSQYGIYDFSTYEAALLSYLENNTVHSASSRLKYALCLAAVGSTNQYIYVAINNSIGEQGLISWVLGMHILNNGYLSDRYTAEDVKTKLLELQCADGGWSIMGEHGDIDATAMTIQALAPYFQNDDAVKNAVGKALVLLSEKQLESGDYSSYGVANPESTAQVLVALSALGIAPETDSRFIKNGNTVLDGIEKYRLINGSLCHKEGGETNGTATVQAFYAAIAYLRMLNGKPSLYILDGADPSVAEPALRPPQNKQKIENTDEATGSYAHLEKTIAEPIGNDSLLSDKAPFNYQWWVCLIIAGVGSIVCAVLLPLGKRNIKNFIAVLIVVVLVITVVCMTDFETAVDYYDCTGENKKNVVGTVTMSIRCDTVAGYAEHIPDNGIILDVAEFEIAEGDTVYTLLTEAARKYKIQFENDGDSTYIYISGINYLYEFDYGDLSGWIYTVNGKRPSVGAGEYKMKDGDTVEWHYTCDLGNDLK